MVVGGGFNAPGTGNFFNLFTEDDNTWLVQMSNHAPSAVYPTFYAECLTAPQAVSKYTDATSPVNGEIEGSYQIGGAQISCPTGQLLTGGGFAFDGSAYVWDYRPQISCPGVSLLTGGGYSNDQDAFTSAYISLPSNSDTWEIAVENNTDNTDTLTINAVCISFN